MSIETKDFSEYAPYENGHAPKWDPEKDKLDEEELGADDLRRRSSIAEGQIKHNKLGWQRLTVGPCYTTPPRLHRPGGRAALHLVP